MQYGHCSMASYPAQLMVPRLLGPSRHCRKLQSPQSNMYVSTSIPDNKRREEEDRGARLQCSYQHGKDNVNSSYKRYPHIWNLHEQNGTHHSTCSYTDLFWVDAFTAKRTYHKPLSEVSTRHLGAFRVEETRLASQVFLYDHKRSEKRSN